MSVRTRFSPSPTGQVHIGNIRTALFNWLFARNQGGSFLLRIEDTDRERSTPEAVQAVRDALNWLGLDADEEPLFQSTRREAHLEAAGQLLSRGLAYREDKGNTGQGEATILRMPDADLSFTDEIRGTLIKKAGDVQDLVIVRSNGTPVFHLANVLDDIEMGVTHVIRGDDHLDNTYRHVALFQALGAPVPRYAHLPMIVNAQGKPYSKRDGDAFVGDFRERGFLPEVLFNYLALLGWSPGDDQEVMDRETLARKFDLGGVQTSAARMDLKKLEWMNGEYVRAMAPADYAAACRSLLEEAEALPDGVEDGYVTAVLGLMQERTKRLPDIVEQTPYFFREDYPFDEKAVRKRLNKPEALDGLRALRDRYRQLDTWTEEALDQGLRELAEEREVGAGVLVHPIRVAVSGVAGGPGLFELLALLGKERVLGRIDAVLERFGA